MSRAFVKEQDDQADRETPARPQSPHINYVTPRGLALLRQKVEELAAARQTLAGREDLSSQPALRELDRELAYYSERLSRAVRVEPRMADDAAHFGASVCVEDATGERITVVIVGEDEADVATGRISWVSPLAKALMNARVGDVVTWRRPAGDRELEILAINGG